MSRTSFFTRSPPSHDRDASPLLPQHRNSVSLRDLSPRSSDFSPEQYQDSNPQGPLASPSPPPSFYRDNNTWGRGPSRGQPRAPDQSLSLSPSPSRTKREPRRRIQFLAPPPPIASSVLLPSASYNAVPRSGSGGRALQVPGESSRVARSASPRLKKGSTGLDPLVGLERREKAIQRELQALLDAQSAGLVQGFGGDVNGRDGGSDTGSSTPTSRSIVGGGMRSGSRTGSEKGRTGGIIPVRQPKGKTLGLRGARRGLLREMGELVHVKNEEIAFLSNEILRREEVLSVVRNWETRIDGAKKQIDGVTTNDEADAEADREMNDLQDEERAIDNEIREMEDQLAQMKAKKRWLGERIKEGINKREARLSSYRGALKEVESEVKEFLRRPPLQTSVVMGGEEGFEGLPSGRRTLGMAKEWWGREVERLGEKKEEIEVEKGALEEGRRLWEASILVVMEFEDELRTQMKNGIQAREMLAGQIEKMGTVITKLGETVALAESKGWNLLICAVGAELEAFKEGEAILRGALQVLGDSEEPKHADSSMAGPDELGGSIVQKSLPRSASVETEESEDDAPNLAELLVDRGDGVGDRDGDGDDTS